MSNIITERENIPRSVNIRTTDLFDNYPSENIKINKGNKFIPTDNGNNSNDDTGNDCVNEDMGLEFLTNEDKRVQESIDGSEISKESIEEYRGQEQTHGYCDDYDPLNDEPIHRMNNNNDKYTHLSYEEIEAKKSFFLSRLKRLSRSGYSPSRMFGMEHSIEELESEFIRITKERELDQGLSYCKQGLVFVARTLEVFDNVKIPYTNSKVQLNGWSKVVYEERDNYDEVFEELYEKYSSSVSVGPEFKLLTMFGGSALMFHMSKLRVDQISSEKDLDDLTNEAMKMKSMGQQKQSGANYKMKGPSETPEDILNNIDIYSDTSSDVSSIMSSTASEKIIIIPSKQSAKKEPVKSEPKKRGRPRKINK